MALSGHSEKPKVIFLMGPTASGKTDLAIEIAKLMPAHLISVDSALVYRGMDIGTAKPDKETLDTFPHALVNIRDPSEPYSVAEFVEDAREEVRKAQSLQKLPLLVGGSMLYFRALYEGLDDLPPADMQLRAQIDKEAEKLGWPEMHARLAKIDPETAARLHPNHNQRIQRALEVHEITGVPLSQIHASQSGMPLASEYDVRQLAIMPSDRKTLHERISKRLDWMFQQGFVEEVTAMYARGDLHTELPSVRAVGYRQLWSYLDTEVDLEEARYRALVATRNLAKRQLTWLRGWKQHAILYTDTHDGRKLELSELVKKALKHLEL